MNTDWERQFDNEFGIHFKDSVGELQFAKEFIRSILEAERAKLLRSEIEKLEGRMRTLTEECGMCNACEVAMTCETLKENIQYNTALNSIITRYKEELLELDRN